MSEDDLPAVVRIQASCYAEPLCESAASFLAKLRASPATCLVAVVEGRVAGYLFSLPAEFAGPPSLNAEACRLPEVADGLYLHDMAVAPLARGTGAGQALVEMFFARLQSLRLARAFLTAVQGAGPYWARYGFRTALPSAPLQAKLASYGEGAQYMEWMG